jgi:hypothetical protein
LNVPALESLDCVDFGAAQITTPSDSPEKETRLLAHRQLDSAYFNEGKKPGRAYEPENFVFLRKSC